MSGSGQATWGQRGGNILVLAGEEERGVEPDDLQQEKVLDKGEGQGEGAQGADHLVQGVGL